MTVVNKQILSDEAVNALVLDVPTGSHDHVLDGAKTPLGGAHAHSFMLPNGNIVSTGMGGAHEHDVEMYKPGEFEAYGGDHSHPIDVDGDTLYTDNGYHWHHWEPNEPEEEAMPSGQHCHRLMLKNGTILHSLMPGDRLMELAREAAMLAALVNVSKSASSEYPETRWNIAAKAYLASVNGQVQLRFVFKLDDQPVALTMNIARPDSDATTTELLHKFDSDLDYLESAVQAFGLRGSRHTVDMLDTEVPATYKSVKTESDSTTKRVLLDTAQIDLGYQSSDIREFFVKGDKLRGRIVLRATSDGYAATFTTDLVPLVVSKAGASLDTPPFGVQAMPPWCAWACPVKLAFWSDPDKASAAKKRAALIASGFFTSDTLALVANEVRKIVVEKRVSLYEPQGEELQVLDLPRVVSAVKSALGEARWGNVKDPRVEATHIELSAEDPLAQAHLVAAVARLREIDKQYLVETADSPAARTAMQALGPVFKIDHPEATSKLFAASFDPTKLTGAPITFVKADSSELLKRIESGADLGWRRIIAKSADSEVAGAAGSGEQRIAYGVVLEPDEVDAQNHTIDADTIRKAAHMYMEHFRTQGVQHKWMVNDKIKLLESYITLVDMEVNGEKVKAGSWMAVVRYDDERLWSLVKAGGITGFSIGGFGVLTPIK